MISELFLLSLQRHKTTTTTITTTTKMENTDTTWLIDSQIPMIFCLQSK